MSDQTRGLFFGPPNLVDLLRHLAAHKGDETAFTYLVDGENEEVSESPMPSWIGRHARHRGVVASSWVAGAAGDAALSAWTWTSLPAFWLSVCGRSCGSGLSAKNESLARRASRLSPRIVMHESP